MWKAAALHNRLFHRLRCVCAFNSGWTFRPRKRPRAFLLAGHYSGDALHTAWPYAAAHLSLRIHSACHISLRHVDLPIPILPIIDGGGIERLNTHTLHPRTRSLIPQPFPQVINALFGAAPIELTSSWSKPSLLMNLAIYNICKFGFTIIAVGCPISCGVFSPVFLLGAAFGRLYGEVIDLITPEDMVITAGAYAVVGAAAMAAGVTRTVSCAVMVFELTGQLNHMLPVLVAVLTAYGVGNAFNKSIYDTMLELNNLDRFVAQAARSPSPPVHSRPREALQQAEE